jgi:hypothetical protein
MHAYGPAILVEEKPLRTSGLVPRAKGSARMFAHTIIATPSIRSRPASVIPPVEAVTIAPPANVVVRMPTKTSVALIATIFAAAIGSAVVYLMP